MSKMQAFQKELTSLLNKHNMEKGSDTPDYILSAYLCDCLCVFQDATNNRDKWYDFPIVHNKENNNG